MYTKLTLNIDKDSIRKAKRYGRRKKISVSRLVENYFESLEPIRGKPSGKISLAKKLMGCAKGAVPTGISENESMALMYEARGKK